MYTNLRTIVAALILGLSMSYGAWANGELGAFVTQSSGSVTFTTTDAQPQPLPPFAKLFAGTTITIGNDGKFQLVYLANGRQESWSGPAELVVEAQGSRGLATAQPSQTKSLPPHMVDVLTRSREVISDIQSRQGMIRVRSLMTARKVKEAEANYAEMRGSAAEDDITPEIYLLTAFDELKVYKRMQAPLREILKRQPNNAEAQRLHDQFMAILEAEEKTLK